MTQVLKEQGFIDDRWFNERSRQIGVATHTAIQYLNEDNLNFDTLHPEILPRVKAYQDFIRDVGFKIRRSEERLYSLEYGFAGTLDIEGTVDNGDDWLVDLKSGKVAPWTALQTGGYDTMLPLLKKPRKRFGLELSADGTYKLTKFDDPMDLNQFLYALSNFHWKLKKGLIREENYAINN